MTELKLSEIYDIPDECMGAAALLGIEKALVTDESFAVVMEIKAAHLNTQGTVHGGILYTLCDQAVGAYIVYKKRNGVGIDGSIRYYRPAKEGDILTAEVFERKSGRRLGVFLTELKDQNGKLLADCAFTAMYQE